MPENPMPMTPARKTSGLAVASMVLGIISLIGGTCFLIPPLLAVIFGHIAVGACKRNPQLEGKGMAIAGLAMGWISIACLIVLILFYGGITALLVGAGLSQKH